MVLVFRQKSASSNDGTRWFFNSWLIRLKLEIRVPIFILREMPQVHVSRFDVWIFLAVHHVIQKFFAWAVALALVLLLY